MVFIISDYYKESGIAYKNINPHIYELGKKKYFIKNEVKNFLLKSFDLYKEFNLNLNHDIFKENVFKEIVDKLLVVYDNLIYHISKNIYNLFLGDTKIYVDLFGIKFIEEKSVKYNEIQKFINKVSFIIDFTIKTDKHLLSGVIEKENMSEFLANIFNSLEYLNLFNIENDIIEFNVKERYYNSNHVKNIYTISFLVYFSIKTFDKNILNENTKKILVKKSMEENVMYKNNFLSETKILNNDKILKIKEYKNFNKLNNKRKINNLKSITENNNNKYDKNYFKKHLSVSFDYLNDKLLIKLKNNETDWKEYKKEFNIENIDDIYKKYKNIFKNINKSFIIINNYKNQSMKDMYHYNRKILQNIEREITKFKNEINQLKLNFDLIEIL